MKSIKSLTEIWSRGRATSTRDLYALGVLAIAAKGNRALVVPGIIGVLLLASVREGGWFKKRPGVRDHRRGSSACGLRQAATGHRPVRFRAREDPRTD